VIVLWLCCDVVIDIASALDLFCDLLQSLISASLLLSERVAIILRLLSYRFATLCDHLEIATSASLSLCYHSAIALQSLCNCFAIAL
jgi:hypothetical protein